MVEFKLDRRDGLYKLMEVNPKFWGSLDLAIAAGVDFPLLTVRLAAGERTAPALTYRVGLRFQWIWSDLLHAAAQPRAAADVFRDLGSPHVKNDVWWSDLKPNAVEGAFTAIALARRVRHGTLRFPHGKPISD
jgi:predicted ATP-grasp superfamily ATP-dependent carboligase